MKHPFLVIILLTFISSYCQKNEPKINLEESSWIFSDYTFTIHEDYSLYFVQGAGVSRHHHFIFQRFNTNELMQDSSIKWSINDQIITKYEEASHGLRESYVNEYYGKKVTTKLHKNNEVMFSSKDSTFLSPPLNIKLYKNDSIIYDPNDVYARQKNISITPIDDRLTVKFTPTPTSAEDKTYISIAYSSYVPVDIDKINSNKGAFEVAILPPKSELMQYGYKIIRFIEVGNEETEVNIPNEMLLNTPTKMITLSVTRGKKYTDSIDGKTFGLYNISRDGVTLKIIGSK